MRTLQQREPTFTAMVDKKVKKKDASVTALKIDVINRKITTVEILDYESPSDQLDCYLVDHWTMNQFNDTLIVDDEGWLESKTIGGFQIDGNYFAGHGLVVGTNSVGQSANPWLTFEMLERIVTFVDVDEIDRIKERHFR